MTLICLHCIILFPFIVLCWFVLCLDVLCVRPLRNEFQQLKWLYTTNNKTTSINWRLWDRVGIQTWKCQWKTELIPPITAAIFAISSCCETQLSKCIVCLFSASANRISCTFRLVPNFAFSAGPAERIRASLYGRVVIISHYSATVGEATGRRQVPAELTGGRGSERVWQQRCKAGEVTSS